MTKSSDYTITTLSASTNQHDNSVGPNFQAPIALSPLSNRLRIMCLPYVGGGTPNGAFMFNRDVCGATPDISFYTEIIETTNPNGTFDLHVGSIYLDSNIIQFGVLVAETTAIGGNVIVELRRFTNGSTLATLQATNPGSTYQFATADSITVSSADWYDIYLRGTVSDTTTNIRGVYYSY